MSKLSGATEKLNRTWKNNFNPLSVCVYVYAFVCVYASVAGAVVAPASASPQMQTQNANALNAYRVEVQCWLYYIGRGVILPLCLSLSLTHSLHNMLLNAWTPFFGVQPATTVKHTNTHTQMNVQQIE